MASATADPSIEHTLRKSGVIIPRANTRHLMLRDDVADAVRGGRFNVWAVDTAEEGIRS